MAYNIEDKNLLALLEALKEIENIDCIALGGSRVSGNNDSMSDYDLYVYCNDEITYEERSKAITPHCSQAEICNHYWESEDNCIMNNGIGVDIIYRQMKFAEFFTNMITENFKPMNGYSTCFWDNILNSEIIFDKSGKFSEFQKRINIPYSDEMSRKVIENNRNLLSGKLPSYDQQIKKAAERGDLVSVHHRITEFLASYFDIIFALNKVTHKGEKRLIKLCKKYCKKLPESFEENINALLASTTKGNSYEIICDMVEKLDKIL